MPKTKKRIMRKFELEEVSAVDRPASGQRTFIKRADPFDKLDRDTFGKIASFDTFDDAVDFLADHVDAPRHEAMQKVARERPDLLDVQQAISDAEVQASQKEQAEAVAKAKRPTAAHAEFDKRVAEIMERDDVKRSVAMTRARKEHAKAFEKYREAS